MVGVTRAGGCDRSPLRSHSSDRRPVADSNCRFTVLVHNEPLSTSWPPAAIWSVLYARSVTSVSGTTGEPIGHEVRSHWRNRQQFGGQHLGQDGRELIR